MQGLGQVSCFVPPFMKGGPVDLSCGTTFHATLDDCSLCINTQNNLNAQVALDNPYMWTHRIVPGLVVGAVVGVLIGRTMR